MGMIDRGIEVFFIIMAVFAVIALAQWLAPWVKAFIVTVILFAVLGLIFSHGWVSVSIASAAFVALVIAAINGRPSGSKAK